jgi:hypothetical protein
MSGKASNPSAYENALAAYRQACEELESLR